MPTYSKRTTKTKGQVWDVTFRYDDGEDSRQKKLSGFPTKKEAQRACEDFIKNFDPVSAKAEAAAKCAPTVSEAYEEYISAMESIYSFAHIRYVKYSFKTHILPCFGTQRVTSITRADVIRWQEMMWSKNTPAGTLYKQNTLTSVHAKFYSFMKWASEMYSFENPFKGVFPPHRREPKREMRLWTVEQFDAFLAHTENETRKMFFSLVFYTGCRNCEINALTVDDFTKNDDHYDIKICKSTTRVNGKGMVITPPKTPHSNRTVSVPPFLTEPLDKFLEGKTGFLWKYASTYWNRLLTDGAKKAGLPHIGVHDLRHSHASILISEGAPVTAVSKRLGHSSPSMTLAVYTHPIDENEKDVKALVDKLWDDIIPNIK